MRRLAFSPKIDGKLPSSPIVEALKVYIPSCPWTTMVDTPAALTYAVINTNSLSTEHRWTLGVQEGALDATLRPVRMIHEARAISGALECGELYMQWLLLIILPSFWVKTPC